jgi:CheY-like chemotaxis protein
MIKVLVVEDEQGVRKVLTETFERVGYVTFAASTAKEAMEIFVKEKPEAVFLDLILPDKEGIELLREMKAVTKTNIVIVVSSRTDLEIQKKAKTAGAAEFITKPFFREHLRNALAHNLKKLQKTKARERAKILIVDDEEDVCYTLSRHLNKRLKADLVVTYDGDQAYHLMKNNTFDLVFMDIKLPGMDGLTIIEKTKKRFPNTHFLVITGYMGEEFLQRAKKLGVTDYFHKPVKLKEIYKKIEEILTAKNKFVPGKSGK